ncbi:protocadherin-3-like, partial [Dreissena polymorpha]
MEPAESLSCFVCVFAYLINLSENTNVNYAIPEGWAPNRLIGNVAADSKIRETMSEEEFRNLQYYFLNIEDKNLQYFAIDSKTSDLTINRSMDWETVCKFSTSWSCPISIDIGTKEKFLKIVVIIELIDVNDNAPSFRSASLNMTFSESDVIGTLKPLDRATDLDTANFSVSHYQLVPATIPFQIQEGSNDEFNLVLNSSLDRESIAFYTFELFAFDKGNPSKNGSVTINIDVEDANDNRPRFTQEKYEITINESVAVNTTIINVTAMDLDIGDNGKIVYSISPDQAPEILQTYTINTSTGEVSVVKNLKYTSSQPIKVKILATDFGKRPLSSSVTLIVTIEDSINVQPEISINLLSSSGQAQATEYASVGTVVAFIIVKDQDGGRNGEVECTINNSHFQQQLFASGEYKVAVKTSLDRETIALHNVTVICQDNGIPRLTTMASFTVSVTDENDNAPKFSKSSYEAIFRENNQVGYVVKQVDAVDADAGNNSIVWYYIDPKDRSVFDINSKSGLITAAQQFDRETTDYYELVVTAVDSGKPAMSSSVTVVVKIEDVNDNSPVFDKARFEYYIPESDVKIGSSYETVLGKITAKDKDINGNGFVLFSLVGNFSEMPFDILPDGTLKTKSTLDREQQEKYDFQVMAIDQGEDVRRSSVVNVTVHVTDINDNFPFVIFPNEENYVKTITYLMPVQTQVMKVEAADLDYDKNADLTFKITSRNDSQAFEIGRQGEIYVARRLQESDVNLFFLDINISDQGVPPKSISKVVYIDVLAKNSSALATTGNNDNQQNVIIAVVVVVVTLLIAASIIVVILVIKRCDFSRKKYVDSNGNVSHVNPSESPIVSNGRLSPPVTKNIYQNGLLHTILPSHQTIIPNGKQPKDVSFQEHVHVREKSLDSTTESTNQKSVEEHRLASLRLQQAFIQTSNKQWTSQSELTTEAGAREDRRKQEDIHSDLSADTATYDSGIGGSVSDTGDLRIPQHHQLCHQNGCNSKPANRSESQSKQAKILARMRSDVSDLPPERPPPLKRNPHKNFTPLNGFTKSPTKNLPRLSPPISPHHFIT